MMQTGVCPFFVWDCVYTGGVAFDFLCILLEGACFFCTFVWHKLRKYIAITTI